MGLSGANGKQKPDEQRNAILDHVYKSGELFWDTADVYADNEDLLGTYGVSIYSLFRIRTDEMQMVSE